MAAGGARIAISGASGLVGRRLGKALEADGHTLLRLVRREPARRGEVLWDPASGRLDPAALEGIDAFVHLSGESIASGRWSTARKREIVESRTVTTRLVSAALARLASKPVLVSASAIGYYGDRGGEWLDETSPPGRGFLPEVCVEWERACDAARAAGLRVVNPRIGVVLDPSGGALAAMLLPFRFGLGGKLGSGSQYVAWITLDDLVGAIRHCIVSETLSGPVNAVAPAPVTNAELTTAIARALGRPAFLRVPATALRLALGEAADELLLGGARVSSRKLEASGYEFRDRDVDRALARLLG
ncbi:MAG: TIGR01777 family protein [Deltaproteobacteria bacterium]|nr:TIGR01777 family protein [Deltaproteobacteria bacterium]